MFFDDPVAAFANIGRTLRPAGRLVMLVWQAAERNEWEMAIRRALAVPADDAGSAAFSLADPAAVRAMLSAAEFADVTFTDVDEPVYYGQDVAAAVERLREMLAAHKTGDGVWFGSRAWIVSAAL